MSARELIRSPLASPCLDGIAGTGVGLDEQEGTQMKKTGPRDLLKRARVDEAGLFRSDLSAQSSGRRDSPLDALLRYEGQDSGEFGLERDDLRAERVVTLLPSSVESSEEATLTLELKTMRAVKAKLARVDSRLEALQEWAQETRVWTERVESGHKAQRRLAKKMLEAQARVDSMLHQGETESRRIIEEAEKRAAKILNRASKRAEALVAEASSALDGAEDVAAAKAARPELEERRSEDLYSEQLLQSIKVFVGTNSLMLDDLNRVITAMEGRQHYD